jgi:hypothetical protein
MTLHIVILHFLTLVIVDKTLQDKKMTIVLNVQLYY